MLRNQFRSLVVERYVERVPPCTLPPPPTNVRSPTAEPTARRWLPPLLPTLYC